MEPVQVDTVRCKGCGLCIEFCPKHCLELESGLNPIGYHPAVLHKTEDCSACGLCAEVCPESGIKVFRKKRKKP